MYVGLGFHTHQAVFLNVALLQKLKVQNIPDILAGLLLCGFGFATLKFIRLYRHLLPSQNEEDQNTSECTTDHVCLLMHTDHSGAVFHLICC